MDLAGLKKILYVEDEDDIRAVGEMALQMGSWEIVCCSSGVEALNRVIEANPDLIITDVMMPGLDGPGVLKGLKENTATSHIPVIFMTAKVQRHEVENFQKNGAIAVISKPFDPMTLAEDIKKIWLSV